MNKYMRRAVELARLGLSNVAPNPHVGAVIVAADGRIIGEGSHRCCGKGHAEVNAFASVCPEDEHLLSGATLYVTLEPCSHYGKTPPCARLIVEKGIKKVVVGCGDPNPKVNGRGIEIIRNAGIEVEMAVGEDAEACRSLDPVFMSRFRNGRPFVSLKWAMSADGYMAAADGSPVRFSTPLTLALVHQLRASRQAILTSGATVRSDNPRLDCRLFDMGVSPVPVIVSRGNIELDKYYLGQNPYTLLYNKEPEAVLADLMERGIGSVLVEAGPELLGYFIEKNLFDEIRVEISPVLLGKNGGKAAPLIPRNVVLQSEEEIDGNRILRYIRIDD